MRGVIASATNVTGRKRRAERDSRGSGWQTQAWHFYDVIGEFEFVANWTGNLLSRAKLYVTKNGQRVPDNDPGAIALKALFNSESGRSGMQRELGVHFTVAGEAWLVSWAEGGRREWRVVAPQNLTEAGGKYAISGVEIKDENPMVIRLWQRHPYLTREATSPARAALPILAEIEKLTMHVSAQTDSRLANAGVMLLPNEITVASSSQGSGTEQDNATSAQKFVSEFYRAASEALANPEGPGALVPIVLSADAEHLEQVRVVQFWSALDEHAKDLRAEAIRRLALSMDIPPEVLTGTGDANHWSAWSVDESSIKSHSEPLLRRLCADLTEGYLRYAIADDVDDVLAYEIEADTSEMRLRPNRSKEAIEMYDRGELSDEALRRENGFDGTDAPDDNQFKMWLLKKLATGSSTPDMMAAALAILGISLPATVDTSSRGREDRPDPSLDEHPRLDPPDPGKAAQVDEALRKAALVAASEQMVFRALERAGNKLGNQFKFAPEDVAPSERYLFKEVEAKDVNFLLADSFGACERFATQYGVTAKALSAALYGYCQRLIVEQRPHSSEDLAQYLTSLEA